MNHCDNCKKKLIGDEIIHFPGAAIQKIKGGVMIDVYQNLAKHLDKFPGGYPMSFGKI